MADQVWIDVWGRAPDPSLVEPVSCEPRDLLNRKPTGGFWSCPHREDGGAYLQDVLIPRGWGHHVRRDRYRIRPEPTARLLAINSKTDLAELPYHRRTRINFLALATAYDGVHLTAAGAADRALPAWECEQVFWFGWRFKSVTLETS